MPSNLSSQPFFIKIKYKDSIRKVQVAQQPAPVWFKLATAIRARFAISDQHSIGLRYFDPDGDLITISSQVELDELWEEIKAGAKLKEKDGVDRKLIKLDLIIIDSEPKSEFVLLESSDVDQAEATASVHSPGSGVHTILGSPVDDLNSPSNHSVAIESINFPREPIEAPAEPIMAPAEPIVDSATCQPSHETQSAPDPPEEVAEDNSPPPSSRANASLGMEHLPALIAVAVGSVAPELQRTLGSYAQLMVDATSQLNDACRVVAERLQDPPEPAPWSHPPNGFRAEPRTCAPTPSVPDVRHVPAQPDPGQPHAPSEMPVPPPKPSVRPYHEPFAMPPSRFGPPHLSSHPFHTHRGMRMSHGFGHMMPPFGTARGPHPHSFFRMPSHSPPHHRMASPPPHRRMASPPLYHHRMTSPPPPHQRMASPPPMHQRMSPPLLHRDKTPSPVLASRQVPPGAAIWEQLMAPPEVHSKPGTPHAPSVVQSPGYVPSLVETPVYAPSVFSDGPRHSPVEFLATPSHSPSVYHAAPVLRPTEEFDEFQQPAGDGNESLKGVTAHRSHEYVVRETRRLERERANALLVHALGGRSEDVGDCKGGDWKGKRAGETGRKKRCKGGIQWGVANEEGVSDQLKFPVIRSAGSVDVIQDEWGIKAEGKKNGGAGGGRRGSKIPAQFSWDD